MGHLLTLFSGRGSGAAPFVPPANTESFWTLDEASGTRFDTVAGNNLTDNNSVGGDDGHTVGSNAAAFVAASSQYLSIASVPSLVTGTDPYTLIGWAWINDTGTYSLISKWVGGNEFILYTAGGFLKAFVNGVGAYTGSAIAAGQWNLVALRYNPTTGTNRLTVGATTVTNTTIGGTGGVSGTAPLLLGHEPAIGSYLDGKLDNWGFVRRELSDVEIAAWP